MQFMSERISRRGRYNMRGEESLPSIITTTNTKSSSQCSCASTVFYKKAIQRYQAAVLDIFYKTAQKKKFTARRVEVLVLQLPCSWSSDPRLARRNQVLKAETRCGHSSTLRVEKLRHCCSSSWDSDMGSVEIICRNFSSNSW